MCDEGPISAMYLVNCIFRQRQDGTKTEDGYRLENSNLARRGIELYLI